MRKTVLVIAIAMAMIACKEEKQDTAPIEESAQKSLEGQTHEETEADIDAMYVLEDYNKEALAACTIFDSASQLTVHQQVLWLRNNQNLICGDNNLIRCIKDLHLIKTLAEYNTARVAFWGNETPKETTFLLGDFLNSGCHYNDFFSFEPDSEGNIYKRKINYFSLTSSCYSLPFFKSLQLNYNLSNNTQLVFTLGIINGEKVIMFKIPGVSQAYFDYSHFPTGSGRTKDKIFRYTPGKTPF